MWHEESVFGEFFEKLAEFDEKIARAVAAGGCVHCGGPLHRGDYERKPRGGLIAEAGEGFTLRHSLCCGREGCRKRALPPSLRFLGRRVYLEAVVLLATVHATVAATMSEARAATGVPVRTLRRWRAWWTEVFPKLDAWIVLRARFVAPPPEETELPKSLLERITATLPAPPAIDEVLEIAARLLAPVTTRSVADGSRFVRVAVPR
jgi:hypothetical protein